MAPWTAPSVLLGRPLEALKTKENGSGKKREVERAHHDEEREQRRLGTAASRGRRTTPAMVLHSRSRGNEGEERGKNEEGRGAGARGLFKNPLRRGGGGERGSGGFGLAVSGRERERERSGGGGWRKRKDLTGGSHPSAARERGGRGKIGQLTGPRPRRGREAVGYFKRKQKNPQAHGYRCSFHPGVFQSIDFPQRT